MNWIINVLFLTLTLVLTQLFCVLAKNTRLMDKPNERSMHAFPKVRGGGLIFIGLSLVSMPLLCYLNNTSFAELAVLFIGTLLVAGISFLDDLFNLSARTRFLVQCVVAGLIILGLRPPILDFVLFSVHNPYAISFFIFFTVLWAINHFNFMDGLDGFCASQALFLFAAYALLFSFHGAMLYQNYCLVLISCLVGFLFFNFPPARLFMGDVGSATLGFISFAIAVIAQQKLQIPILYWFVLNALFLFDATITLIRRILKKEKWSSPHKKHAYQRIKQFGVDIRVILLGQFFINCMMLIAILMFQQGILSVCLLLVLLMSILLLTYYSIEKCFPMFPTMNFK